MKHNYCLAMAAALLFSGCSEDEVAPTLSVDNEDEVASTLSVDKTSINVALPTMAADSIVVTSNSAWTATLENLADTAWCLVSPSGTGNGTVYVDVLRNKTDEDRSAKVVLTAGTLSKVVNVTQTSVTTVPPENSPTIEIEMVNVEGNGTTISNFKIGKYEVTEGQWQAVMGNNPSYDKRGADYPVDCVSWYDVIAFIGELYRKTGKYYDLPTSEQWLYAARGGKNKDIYIYSGSNTIDDVAWYAYNSSYNDRKRKQKVGTKAANALGIYDMTGNLYEWTNSTIVPGEYRMQFGGSFLSIPQYCESERYSNYPRSEGVANSGFRLVEFY
ncbi:hypothetical protein AGMMS49965_03460 [Bacteroidia bacterium]|nr:hypothetical protein AGMMS49965_03460 [Bacteroidia bacterium]